jgi:flagellar hook-associated protein 2
MASPAVSSSSGPLDVQGLVSQLMTVANQPLTRMKSQVSTYGTQISDYGTLSSDLSAMQTSLNPLSTGAFINTFKATSSDPEVLSASADTTATAGIYSITVNNLATTQNLAFKGQASSSDSLGNLADTLNFSFGDGTVKQVSIDANSNLQQISSAINSAGIGVNASVVKADSSSTPYRLVLTGTGVGAEQAFSTSATSGQLPLSFLSFDASSAMAAAGNITDSRLTSPAKDASLVLNGLALTSSSNTLNGVISGTTINLTKTGTTNLQIASDGDAIVKQVQAFVDAYNRVRNDSDRMYVNNLKGDYTLVSMQDQFSGILNTPISGADGASKVAYLAQVGISVQKDGTLSLNTAALSSEITHNSRAVANVFGNGNNDGAAQRLNAMINNMLGPRGLITTRTSTLNTQVKDINHQVDRETTKLSTMQDGYITLYTKLNSSLSQMQQTSSSLSAALRG